MLGSATVMRLTVDVGRELRQLSDRFKPRDQLTIGITLCEPIGRHALHGVKIQPAFGPLQHSRLRAPWQKFPRHFVLTLLILSPRRKFCDRVEVADRNVDTRRLADGVVVKIVFKAAFASHDGLATITLVHDRRSGMAKFGFWWKFMIEQMELGKVQRSQSMQPTLHAAATEREKDQLALSFPTG